MKIHGFIKLIFYRWKEFKKIKPIYYVLLIYFIYIIYHCIHHENGQNVIKKKTNYIRRIFFLLLNFHVIFFVNFTINRFLKVFFVIFMLKKNLPVCIPMRSLSCSCGLWRMLKVITVSRSARLILAISLAWFMPFLMGKPETTM